MAVHQAILQSRNLAFQVAPVFDGVQTVWASWFRMERSPVGELGGDFVVVGRSGPGESLAW